MQSEPEPLHDEMVDASHLISHEPITPSKTSEPLCTIEVKPRDQVRQILGNYSPDVRLRGFSIEFDPDPVPEDSVVTQVTNIKVGKKFRLYLHVANFSNNAITATVREL